MLCIRTPDLSFAIAFVPVIVKSTKILYLRHKKHQSPEACCAESIRIREKAMVFRTIGIPRQGKLWIAGGPVTCL